MSKYIFLEVGLNLQITCTGRCIPNITLRVVIGVYKNTGEEKGQIENLDRFRGSGLPRFRENTQQVQ